MDRLFVRKLSGDEGQVVLLAPSATPRLGPEIDLCAGRFIRVRLL